MNARHALLTMLAFAGGALVAATEPFDAAMQDKAADLRARLGRAAEELNQTRTRIAQEKAPLLAQLRAAEDRALAAESAATRLEIRKDESGEQRRKLLQELEALRKTTVFAGTLAHESLRTAIDGLAPGEDQAVGDRFDALRAALEDPVSSSNGRAAMDSAEFLAARLEQSIGGYRFTGSALLADNHQLVPGTFAFAGPETFFLPAQGGAGTVRPREGNRYPVCFALPQWPAADAAAFFAGRPAAVLADASGGKALRLEQTRGTFWQHVRKGGMVSFAIIGVGAFALLLILRKAADLRRMGVATAAATKGVLAPVARGAFVEAGAAAQTLARCTREIYAVGLASLDLPKAILEERLQAELLAQRLHYERRLPMLAVIATAAPLMGLLGTVIGMVKTFALITVWGTGNAGKLSSGISEVLVATELGLTVAIPTLIVHAFLAQRIQKNLLQLERQALEFVTAVETARHAVRPGAPAVTVR